MCVHVCAPVHMGGYVCGGQPLSSSRLTPQALSRSFVLWKQDVSQCLLTPPLLEQISQAQANNTFGYFSVCGQGGTELRHTMHAQQTHYQLNSGPTKLHMLEGIPAL